MSGFSLESLRKELQVVLTSDDIPSIPSEDDLEYEEQDNPTLFDIIRKNPKMTYNEAVVVQEDMRLAKEAKAAKEKEGVKKYKTGVCVTGALKKDLSRGKEIDYHRYWKDMYEKEHKLRQEAQGETTIVKGIGMSSPEMKKAQARIKELEEILRSKDYTKAHDYKFLTEENKKLHKEVDEVRRDNKTLTRQIDDQVTRARKAGM